MITDDIYYKKQATELRQRAETKVRNKTAQSPTMTSEEIERIIHDLEVHQIELEMQNEELLQANTELDVARQRYFDFYNLAPVGYLTVSETELILEANLTVADIFNVPRGAFIQQPITRLIHKVDQDIYYILRNKCLETEKPQACELRMIKKDGRIFWAGLIIDVDQESMGVPVYRIVLRDITARKQAEETMQENEQNYRNLADSGQALIRTSGIDRLCNYCNRVWLQFTGRSLDQETRNGWPEGVHPDDIERCLAIYIEAFDKKEKFSMEYRLRRYDDIYRWIVDEGCPRYDSKNLFVGYINHCLDIHDRKLAEEEKINLQTRLNQAQKMEAIGTLAGGIAHDFNNILASILGYAEMIREDIPSETSTARDLAQVIKASNRAKDLVKQILAFSRLAETENIPLQPALLVKETIKFLRATIPMTIAIEYDVDKECAVIIADPTKIHQVLMNLCTNAFHAMEENGGTLSISLMKKALTLNDLAHEPHLLPGNYVQLSVRDTGAGINPEIKAKIFDPYFTTKETGKGTGMGLAITHGIVKNYGGFITCESKVGEGTVFHINLPSLEEHILPEVRHSVEPTSIGTERILLVDDEPMLAEMAQQMFERLGYHVTLRTNSIEALTTFKKQPDDFDLVITDQTMPGMLGVDLASRMLQIRPSLPIIICTGYSNRISKEQIESVGIKGFALKPFSKNDIAALIRRVLDEIN